MVLTCGVGEDCWESWTARRPNQSILKEVGPEYSLEGLMLKLKLQYLGHLMWRTDSYEKALMLGKIEGRRKGWQRMICLDSITVSMDLSLSKFRDLVMIPEAWSPAVHGVTKSRTQLSDWTELNPLYNEIRCVLQTGKKKKKKAFSFYFWMSWQEKGQVKRSNSLP